VKGTIHLRGGAVFKASEFEYRPHSAPALVVANGSFDDGKRKRLQVEIPLSNVDRIERTG
jgi:hypothetical protein